MAAKSHSFKTTSAPRPRERKNPLYNIPQLVRFQSSAPQPRQSASFPTHKSLKLRLPPWSRIPFLSRLEGGGVYYNSQASTLRYTKTLALPPSSPSSGTAVREAFIHPLIFPHQNLRTAPAPHAAGRVGRLLPGAGAVTGLEVNSSTRLAVRELAPGQNASPSGWCAPESGPGACASSSFPEERSAPAPEGTATALALRTALGSGVRSGGSLGFARAPPLPLFTSDAAVEAAAAAAAAAAGHGVCYLQSRHSRGWGRMIIMSLRSAWTTW